MSAAPEFRSADEPLPNDWFDFDPEAGSDEFVPVNTDDANRLLWHLRSVTRTIAKDRALYDAERARLDRWLADRTAGPLNRQAAIERALEGWARMALRADPKVKSHSLPNGVVKLTKARAHVEIVDADALVSWARTAGRFDLLTVNPSKSALATLDGKLSAETEDCVVENLVTDEGEIVPGAALVTARSENFSVTPAGEWGKK